MVVFLSGRTRMFLGLRNDHEVKKPRDRTPGLTQSEMAVTNRIRAKIGTRMPSLLATVSSMIGPGPGSGLPAMAGAAAIDAARAAAMVKVFMISPRWMSPISRTGTTP